MDKYLWILGIVVIGLALLYFGYNLFFGPLSRMRRSASGGNHRGQPGPGLVRKVEARRTCPVCSIRLLPGERVKSWAFPAGRTSDRLMNIAGCPYCLRGDRPRICPVCGAVLGDGENLIARLFDKPGRSHVHVLGCSQCRG
jgi:RNase P subunit RPR2